jgi:hypothetical protein
MIDQNRNSAHIRAGSSLPAALLLLVGISIVTAGEMCLEAALQQVVESALEMPRPLPAPDVTTLPAERDATASVAADAADQRAIGIRVVRGMLLGEDLAFSR